MGLHKSATTIALAVLVAVLSISWLASAAPVIIAEPHTDNDRTPLLDKTLTDDAPHPESNKWLTDHREYESQKIAAIRKYWTTRDPNLKKTIDWIMQERNLLQTSRSLLKQLKKHMTHDFWKNMNRYVTNEYMILKETTQTEASPRFRISKWTSYSHPSLEEIAHFRKIDAELSNWRRTREILTETLLNLWTVDAQSESNEEAFKRAIKTAIKVDSIEGNLSDENLVAIAKALVRIDKMFYMNQSIRQSTQRIEKSPLLKARALSKEQIQHLRAAVHEEIRVFEARLWGEELNVKTEQNSHENEDNQRHSSCRYLPAQYNCFLSEEEYGELVREVEEDGEVKKVLNTEQFMELLDRVTAEESAAKREQLLELGADLLRDPEVTLIGGDSIEEFKDAIEPRNEIFSNQMRNFIQRSELPENPLRMAPQVSQFHALDSRDQMRSVFPDGIVPQPQEISLRPSIDIQESVIHPPEYGAVNFHVLIPEFHGEFRSLPVPETIHHVETAPRRSSRCLKSGCLQSNGDNF